MIHRIQKHLNIYEVIYEFQEQDMTHSRSTEHIICQSLKELEEHFESRMVTIININLLNPRDSNAGIFTLVYADIDKPSFPIDAYDIGGIIANETISFLPELGIAKRIGKENIEALRNRVNDMVRKKISKYKERYELEK